MGGRGLETVGGRGIRDSGGEGGGLETVGEMEGD